MSICVCSSMHFVSHILGRGGIGGVRQQLSSPTLHPLCGPIIDNISTGEVERSRFAFGQPFFTESFSTGNL